MTVLFTWRRARCCSTANLLTWPTCLQDVLFEAENITTCFKALATVEQPDDDVSRAQQTAFLEELCSLAQGALPALRPSQQVTLLWSCGR